MKTNKTIELVNMWWQAEYYSESQTIKPLPLTDEDKREGALSKATIATQCPKILRIGLMMSFFHPMIGIDFEVAKVMWLLEYYNMNGNPPHNGSKMDFPRVKLFNCIEGVLNEVNDIIGSAEYQAADFIDAVIENFCTDSNFKKIDQVAALENLYGVEDCSELKISILAWLLGIPIDNVDDAVKQIYEYQKNGMDLSGALQSVTKGDKLIYLRAIDRLLKLL